MLIPLAIAAALGLYFATKRKGLPLGTPGNYLPPKGNIPQVDSSDAKPVVPSDVKGGAVKHTVKMGANRDNRSYTTSVFPIQNGKQYVIAQLNGTSGWVGYYQVGASKPPVRKLYKAYAKGDRDQSGRVVSVIMSDFGVKK